MKLNLLFWLVVGSSCLKFAVGSAPGLQPGVGTNDDQVRRSRRDTSSSSYFYYQKPKYPRDCQEVYDQCDDQESSGIFTIQPDGAPDPFKVYCNNSIDGGGWTVFQRRMDGSVFFYRSWEEYKAGFGYLNREFWLGNDNLSHLTSQGDYELRIDMNNVNGAPYFAKYSSFRISDERSKYRMVELGEYLPECTARGRKGFVLRCPLYENSCSGNSAMNSGFPECGTNRDALTRHLNKSFSTFDQDNDIHRSVNCASYEYRHGAWWYADCNDSNLNGNYFGCSDCPQSISWGGLPQSSENIKYTEMKLRPVPHN